MRRKFLTVFFILMLVLVAIIAYKKNLLLPVGKMDATQSSTVASESKSSDTSTESSNQNGTDDYTAYVEDYQLKEMNEVVEIKNSTGTYEQKFAFEVKNVQISRTLKSSYTVDQDIVKTFNNEVMSDDGTLQKGLYYMYVEVEMTNSGERADYCNASDLKYVMIDADSHMAVDHSSYYNYNDIAQFYLRMYYFNETDGKELLSHNSPSYFQVGDSCEYEVCYIITEEMIENNNLYLMDDYGWNAKTSFQDKDQRYIKLDLDKGDI